MFSLSCAAAAHLQFRTCALKNTRAFQLSLAPSALARSIINMAARAPSSVCADILISCVLIIAMFACGGYSSNCLHAQRCHSRIIEKISLSLCIVSAHIARVREQRTKARALNVCGEANKCMRSMWTRTTNTLEPVLN